MPDWFYRAVLDDALVLTIDRAYFDLTGGLERWLYRIVRKHGGQQRGGWRFDFRHSACQISQPLARSGASPSNCARLSIANRYQATASRWNARLADARFWRFARADLSTGSCGQAVEQHVLSGTVGHVLSGTPECVLSGTKSAVFIN